MNESTSHAAPVGDRAAIAIIANDAVMHWLLPFLESWKATNADLPMHLIPYDDNMQKTREVAKLYGVQVAEIDSRALDALSKKLYPFSLGKRFRLRKLLSLALPLDRMIYLDVDIVLFRDLKPLLPLVAGGHGGFRGDRAHDRIRLQSQTRELSLSARCGHVQRRVLHHVEPDPHGPGFLRRHGGG